MVSAAFPVQLADRPAIKRKAVFQLFFGWLFADVQNMAARFLRDTILFMKIYGHQCQEKCQNTSAVC